MRRQRRDRTVRAATRPAAGASGKIVTERKPGDAPFPPATRAEPQADGDPQPATAVGGFPIREKPPEGGSSAEKGEKNEPGKRPARPGGR